MITKFLKWFTTNLALALTLITLITGASGLSVYKVIDGIKEKRNWHHQLDHNDEMTFHTLRAMTDNDDPYRYHITFGSKRNRRTVEVDVRNTSEGFRLAFVYEIWRIYPVAVDYADSTRFTIKLHDYAKDETKDTELIRE